MLTVRSGSEPSGGEVGDGDLPDALLGADAPADHEHLHPVDVVRLHGAHELVNDGSERHGLLGVEVAEGGGAAVRLSEPHDRLSGSRAHDGEEVLAFHAVPVPGDECLCERHDSACAHPAVHGLRDREHLPDHASHGLDGGARRAVAERGPVLGHEAALDQQERLIDEVGRRGLRDGERRHVRPDGGHRGAEREADCARPGRIPVGAVAVEGGSNVAGGRIDHGGVVVHEQVAALAGRDALPPIEALDVGRRGGRGRDGADDDLDPGVVEGVVHRGQGGDLLGEVAHVVRAERVHGGVGRGGDHPGEEVRVPLRGRDGGRRSMYGDVVPPAGGERGPADPRVVLAGDERGGQEVVDPDAARASDAGRAVGVATDREAATSGRGQEGEWGGCRSLDPLGNRGRKGTCRSTSIVVYFCGSLGIQVSGIKFGSECRGIGLSGKGVLD